MKKRILVFVLIFIYIASAFGLKIIDITQHAAKIAGWVEEYYLLEKEYPEKFEDILTKKITAFDYDIYTYYANLKKDGYIAAIKDKTLILSDSNTSERCVYNFEKKTFTLYEGDIFIEKFEIW